MKWGNQSGLLAKY